MTLNHTARTTTPSIPLSFFTTLLALAALLVGVFAIHSASTGHDLPAPMLSSASFVSTGDLAADVGTLGTTAAAPESVLVSSTVHGGIGNGTWLALTCVLLLGLVALLFWKATLGLQRQLFSTAVVTRISVHAIAWPFPRPDLTLLSVRRV